MHEYPILSFHVLVGAIALLSGAAALLFRKGFRMHRLAGNIFFVSMLFMASVGAYLAYSKSSVLPVVVGILTFYLVATAWATVKHKGKGTGSFEIVALIVALVTGASGIAFGLDAMSNVTSARAEFIARQYFFFGSVALVAAALDVRMIIRGGLLGAQRIARHLWRMCFGLYIAASSFFLGQAQVFPDSVRELQIFSVAILAVPKYVVIALMIFWLSRVLFPNWTRNCTYTQVLNEQLLLTVSCAKADVD